ncbi:phosphonate ABC transporter ATP-binding protein [Reinekea thalattae]|uniref:Phosphonate ABC transporter ATP-binding protein n=1 Tax=Reinekea thalattae TaxID=2593301 RepID=A0A5C8ZBG2_9GAMM|nr:phosphonate ABC transporter ATP-binding protein [Reinekea thalattae]TXR54521.1 phosphonate ABC transporter ATP-binding protein [Reinekea thalattae]
MLTINSLTKNFGGNLAVNNVSLSVESPQMIGIIGRSGAGKSTLLRMINRLNDPTSGEINYLDTAVHSLKGPEKRAWQARCGMVFQQFNLVPRLDVVTNVMLGNLNKQSTFRALFNLFPKEEVFRAIDLLERFGIEEHMAKRADQLSGGQQQRVAICRALMQNPDMVLADEPIASLDPMNAQTTMEALRRIHDEDNKIVLCNLHTLDTARTFCDRVIGMRDGRVVFDGPANALSTDVAREIYGADENFSETSTSTNINALPSDLSSTVKAV